MQRELNFTSDMFSDLFKKISERMKEYPGRRLRRVVLQIGKSATVIPDALHFTFNIYAAANDIMKNATLEILSREGAKFGIKLLEIE